MSGDILNNNYSLHILPFLRFRNNEFLLGFYLRRCDAFIPLIKSNQFYLLVIFPLLFWLSKLFFLWEQNRLHFWIILHNNYGHLLFLVFLHVFFSNNSCNHLFNAFPNCLKTHKIKLNWKEREKTHAIIVVQLKSNKRNFNKKSQCTKTSGEMHSLLPRM